MKDIDYANEPYRRLYTKSTTAWKAMGWKARVTFLSFHKELDRYGEMQMDGESPVKTIFLASGLPEEIIEQGLSELIKRKWIIQENESLVEPFFFKAEETSRSDSFRQRGHREKIKHHQGGSLVYYFFEKENGEVKIGFSICVEDRKKTLEKEEGINLLLLCVMRGGREKESKEHAKWSENRSHGEWFTYDVSMRRYVDEYLEKNPIENFLPNYSQKSQVS